MDAVASGAGADARPLPEPGQTRGDTIIVDSGAVEVVWDYRRSACDRRDFPDVPARAIRLLDGSIALSGGNSRGSFFLYGPDFSHLERECGAAPLPSPNDPSAESRRNRYWIASPFRTGDTVHALVHNEFHDPSAPECRPGDTGPSNPCWYSSVVYAFSTDGARTFTEPPTGARVVAPAPMRWHPTRDQPVGRRVRRLGYFSPTNVIHGPDGYLYAMLRVIPDPADPAKIGVCPMRTLTPDDPSSWRTWDGSTYGLEMLDPYTVDGDDGVPSCDPVSNRDLRGFTGSLTFSTTIGKYMLIGPRSVAPRGDEPNCGFAYSVSDDLVNWSRPVIFYFARLSQRNAPCTDRGEFVANYPSLIDHADTTVNFERSGSEPHLYFVRWPHDRNRERQLVRVPLRIRRAEGA